jgi:hypothetical protein
MSLHIFDMVGPFIVSKSVDCSSRVVDSTVIQVIAQASGQEIGVGVAWRDPRRLLVRTSRKVERLWKKALRDEEPGLVRS